MLAFPTASAGAFELPVHLSLTVWLAELAGFSDTDAFLMAQYDQATDDDPTTSPMPGLTRGAAVGNRRQYHAFRDGTTPRRSNPLPKCADRSRIATDEFRLIGQFLHRLEDQYSHRCCGPILGQLVLGDAPDKPWYAPAEFVSMVEDKFNQLLSIGSVCGNLRRSTAEARSLFDAARRPLDNWARNAHQYAAEDADNEKRWEMLLVDLYGPEHARYITNALAEYAAWKQKQGW